MRKVRRVKACPWNEGGCKDKRSFLAQNFVTPLCFLGTTLIRLLVLLGRKKRVLSRMDYGFDLKKKKSLPKRSNYLLVVTRKNLIECF